MASEDTAGSARPASTKCSAAESVTVAGKLTLIGLDEVRQAMGERWPAMAERAMLVAEHVLRRRLLPVEVFSRTDDHGFIVLFSGGSEKEIAFRAAMLAREIRRKLIGEDGDTAEVAVTAMTEPQPLTAEELATPSPLLARLLDERLVAQRAGLEARARCILQQVVEAPQFEFQVVATSDGSRVPLRLIDLEEATRRKVATALTVLPPGEITGFDIDGLRIAAAAEAMLAQAGEDESWACLVPLEYDALSRRGGGQRSIERLKALGPALLRRVVPTLCQVPEEASRMRVEDTLRLLRNIGKTVAVVIEDATELPFDPTLRLASIVVFDASLLAGQLRHRERQIQRLLGRLRHQGTRVLARGIHTPAEIAAARSAGADFISFSRTAPPYA